MLFLAVAIIVYDFYRKQNTKKKLVYTARVKRLICTNLVLLMIPVVLLAILRSGFGIAGVLAVYTSLELLLVMLSNIINKPVEKAVGNYYINDAKKILKNSPDLKIIGITGSYGKTSVKFYLKTLLEEKFDVLATPESYNTPMGIVKTIRGSLKPQTEIFICEMGARHVGDIKEICDFVHPHYGVITSVGPQHLETFFTQENVTNTKFELGDALPENGLLFLNGDNELINEKAKEYKNTVFYHTDLSGTGYKAKDVTVTENGTRFTVVAPSGEEGSFEMRLIGEHNVANVVGAIAVANSLGMTLKELKIPVRRLESVKHRLELKQFGNVTAIDDAYNSNPVGSRSAVETLAKFNGTRILITPGMVELGAREEELNEKFGTYAADSCDYILLVGKKLAGYVYDGVISKNFPVDRCLRFTTFNEAYDHAMNIKADGHKYILIENDLPDSYN